jgi:hypothetical protein
MRRSGRTGAIAVFVLVLGVSVWGDTTSVTISGSNVTVTGIAPTNPQFSHLAGPRYQL